MNDRSCRRRCRSSGTSGCATPSRFLAALDSAHWGYRRSAASGGHWEVGDYVFPGATTEPTDGDAAVERGEPKDESSPRLCEIAAAPVYAVVHGGHQKLPYFAFFVIRIDLFANLMAMAARTCRAACACF